MPLLFNEVIFVHRGLLASQPAALFAEIFIGWLLCH